MIGMETQYPVDETIEDTSLIERNLSLSPDQRILEHQSALDLFFLFEEAGKEFYAKSELNSKDSFK